MRFRGILLFVLLAICVHQAATSPISRIRRTDTTNTSREYDRSYTRALSIIRNKSEYGRLVLLLCREFCPKERRQIPEWIRSFNEEMKYSPPFETIFYHFYLVRRPLGFLNTTVPKFYPTLVYFIGREPILFEGDITSKDSVHFWLRDLDVPPIYEPATYQELDQRISTGNCSNKYLLYAATQNCHLDHWKNIARFLYLMENIPTVHLNLPLNNEMSVIFYKRLPKITESDCLVLTLLNLNTYTLPFLQISPEQIRERILSLVTHDQCVTMEDKDILPVVPALTELQMEYFTGERMLNILEGNTLYIIVGVAGGISVVALGISIFWGLNGSSFTQ